MAVSGAAAEARGPRGVIGGGSPAGFAPAGLGAAPGKARAGATRWRRVCCAAIMAAPGRSFANLLRPGMGKGMGRKSLGGLFGLHWVASFLVYLVLGVLRRRAPGTPPPGNIRAFFCLLQASLYFARSLLLFAFCTLTPGCSGLPPTPQKWIC